MGTRVERIAVVSRPRWRRAGALELADAAVRRCVAAADPPEHVDLLVNAGLYRDHNLGEPALAALIQDDAGLVRTDDAAPGPGTFSFDVANGTCGPLTALQVVDGFLRSGAIRTAVVVASDADPGRGSAPDFPYDPLGAAALCAWSDEAGGLGPFRWANVPGTDGSFASVVRFEGDANRLRIAVAPDHAPRAARAAAAVADDALAGAGVAPAAVDVVVAAPADDAFVDALGDDLAVPAPIVVAPDPDVHTASLLAALASAEAAGHLRPGGTVLLVSAAAGITVGACTYRA